jgi:hypothetical protein
MLLKSLLLLANLLCLGDLFSQESANTAAGIAVGPNGNCYFSLGQTFVFEQGADANIQPGVQQVYPSNILTTLEYTNEYNISLNPNPASEVILISRPNADLMDWKLFNSAGQLVNSGNFNEMKSIISIKPLANGIYYLSIYSKSELISTQKLIKQ